MSDQPIHSLTYAASLLRTSVVRTFASLAGFGSGEEEQAKARRALSRCLSRAEYDPTLDEISKGRHLGGGRARWSFSHRGRRYAVSVEAAEAVKIVRVVPGGGK